MMMSMGVTGPVEGEEKANDQGAPKIDEQEKITYLYHVNSVDLTRRHLKSGGGRTGGEMQQDDEDECGSVRFSGDPCEIISVRLPFEDEEKEGAGKAQRQLDPLAGQPGDKRPAKEISNAEGEDAGAEISSSPLKKPKVSL
mmetsp:Transcript_5071/g.15226  ORF Transcript_5071/g.15226 Transcript_5071/m.15226 type:complete len:141 (-) Transcript_5071:527-949(-)